MTRDVAMIVAIVLYKLCCLGAGSLFGILGYRLFMAGVEGKAGDLAASFKQGKFSLRSAAPGTFFAVVGAAVIGFTVFKGLSLDSSITGGERPPVAQSRERPPALP